MDNSKKDLYRQIKTIEESIETLLRAKQQIMKELNDLKYAKKEDEDAVENMPDEVLFDMLNQLCDDDLLDNEFFAAADELGKEKQKNCVGEDHAPHYQCQNDMSSQIDKTECYDEFIGHQSFYVGLVAEQIKIMIENNMVFTNSGPISKNDELDVTQFFEECFMQDSEGIICAPTFAVMSIFNIICEDFQIDEKYVWTMIEDCANQLQESDTDIYYGILNDVVKRINFLLKQK